MRYNTMPDKHIGHRGDCIPGPQKRPPVTQYDAPGPRHEPSDKDPEQTIRVDVPGEGFFTITKDVAELWLHQIMIQLEKIEDDKLRVKFRRVTSGEMPLDSENPTPLVGMD
jgi:hypothetical protein